MAATHLVIISDRTALSWVLAEQRMAFPTARAQVARAIQEGDEVLLYSTRRCFGSPTRDLGRIIARGSVTSQVRTLDEPVVFGERSFTEGCDLRIHGLAPFREGLVLRDLVTRLEAFPDPRSWSARMRRPSLALSTADADLLRRRLEPGLKPYVETVAAYRWPAGDPPARSL
ncbi:hypothetical protein OG618_08210 [Kitasatospora sp. NBC_01246]|uniref:hypothetical protein n=1 Tax=Kitasatospora sp. NBC_01246 TaxID=2903570 RepID=UPI002E31FBF8|nr:hypothetical protein [Kitasatospora sp. NBC_01246]